MTIALPKAKTTPTADLATKTTLIYGPPKIGKSTFAAQFPDALFFECEPGLGELSVYKVPTYSWPDLLEACKLVAAGGHPFKTVVIDTIDNAFKYCTDHINAKHNVEYEGDLAHGKGWAFVKNEWHRVLTRLASLPMGLVLISHAVDKRIETRTGEYTKTQPSLPDRARQVVLGMVDMILYCDTVSRPRSGGDGKGVDIVRVMRTKPHPTYEAGDRTGRLPEVMPLDFAGFAKCFASAKPASPMPSSSSGQRSVASAPPATSITE
ncbi:MAG: ATP-binding protein [Phycisphaeraceae bacterium]|nr:ATP-binding protein [Phycisphaeraceae bacterium]